MAWTSRYQIPSKENWQGRIDSPEASYFFQVIQLLDLQRNLPKNFGRNCLALLGFACDEGIKRNLGRTGAAQGPDQIKKTLAKFPIQKQNIVCYDAGNIICKDGDLENAQAALGELVHLLLAHDIIPIVLGGGHELAWGHYQGIAEQYPTERLGIINFDAHFDMRPLLPHQLGSSGTPFLQIALAHESTKRHLDYNCIGIQHAGNAKQLFETAKHYHANIIFADDLHMGFMEKCVNFVDRIVDQNQIIYLSLCLDVFAAAYAPGVSAPQAMGLNPWQIVPLVRQLASSGKMISYDLAELSPPFDIDHRTAKVAANFIYEIIHHHQPFIR
ncbi:MAG: formimidoylglutamase [Gammaproteobacteria bacterium RIFCSPHIGHO2_12_FULL_42_10]|nr:MAG: formimidoylglutamase [Gammaproteobacteria bacterium RIFCSPHIGHO2_12_FULL_42_10]